MPRVTDRIGRMRTGQSCGMRAIPGICCFVATGGGVPVESGERRRGLRPPCGVVFDAIGLLFASGRIGSIVQACRRMVRQRREE